MSVKENDYKKDKIKGTDRNDFITSFNGNDTINEKKGTNLIQTGSGKDTINGGKHMDLIFGEDGNPYIRMIYCLSNKQINECYKNLTINHNSQITDHNYATWGSSIELV